ncbi:hypothetical protein FK545_00960 [Planococcus glaciei]|nr:hypothetical protein [Planococcus glaciei]QDY44606.1 hypothetical protein FK545_00960 [Planococcus glaciei]
MNNRDIAGFVQRAGRRLKSVHISQSLQKALLIGLTAAVLLLFLSRLFMLPYYEFYAYAAGALALLVWLAFSIRNLPDQHQAVTELDRFTPHNQLLTAWQTEGTGELATALVNKTAEMLPHSYQLFKQEPRQWLLGKWLLASLAGAVFLSLLLLFPSTLQQEAKDAEKERDLISQIEKQVAKIEKEAKSEPLKKRNEGIAKTSGGKQKRPKRR